MSLGMRLMCDQWDESVRCLRWAVRTKKPGSIDPGSGFER